ncbi:MAG: hypothetical protein OXU30_09955 [Gammaproteobacteria bacterium]|nr:hypothetical protein [Gammaproteobacteria bacterium]
MTARFRFSDSINLIKNIRTTGTITPSSKNLVRRLLSPINFAEGPRNFFVRPGNGWGYPFQVKRLGAQSLLGCLEVNNEFVAQLNCVEDSRLRVYNACASSLRQILDELGIDKVDYVVSSLPLALIDHDIVESILVEVDSNLKEGGRFLQYQYSLANYSDMKPFFRDVKLKFTLRNMPPAFVYECTK